ncbi:chaplin ChpD [Streptomyces durmitorensis]|uniref:Chaplin n=1 Tax=Streptomyces durmitorensis TaxID=319947 RepID=A0ABY4PPH5_9ACTN|nr:chaplin [Streptomyces durmitorensis]UQT55030.1 chaplin [Streptomyces durmitorensis]
MRKCAILAAAAFAAVTVIGGAGSAVADPGPGAYAEGTAQNSPGVLSGNLLQVPVDVPINACGNSLNVVGLLNPAAGNNCQ